MTSDTGDASFAAAFAHHEAGRTETAREAYRDILARDPGHVESLHLLGLITAGDGDPEAGAQMIRRAMGLVPGHAPHHNSLAFAYKVLGRNEDAIREYRAAAALRPESAEIHNNLATLLRELGQHEAATDEYRRAAACAPGIAEIWYNLASTLVDRGQTADVEASFRRAIDLRPEFVPALANLGRWLATQARWAEADAWLSEAVRLAPNHAPSWNNLGIVRQELGRTVHAEANYRRALLLEPEFADAHYNLGCLLFGDGRSDEAIAHHEAAVAADRLHGSARLALCMARLPILYGSDAEVATRRVDYLTVLGRLSEAAETPDIARAVAAAIGTWQPFFLPYQGENDREPQAILGTLACRLLADREASPPPRRPARGDRIRLGIVSGYFHDHTIFRLFLQGWLSELDRDRFEVIACHTGRTSDADTARAADSCDRFVHGMPSGAAWRDAIASLAPDALLYPEVGMDPVAGRLAALRLAPVQCVAWGHPETTGMPTMDHFLSAELMEAPDGDTHYTERLVRLPDLGLHFTPDERTVPPLDREALGIGEGVPVYWSGQALYKYQPKYDWVFPRIAAAVGECRFIFIDFAKSRAVTAKFRERLGLAFAMHGLDPDRYCVFLPPMSQQRFVAAVGMADVILDTPGWSGGRSTLDCLAVDPAIVTLPGPLMRGRHTAAILRRIGCEATIAASLDDYVSIAVRLGLDAAWRARVRYSVAEGKHRAFRDTLPVRALEAFLLNEVAR